MRIYIMQNIYIMQKICKREKIKVEYYIRGERLIYKPKKETEMLKNIQGIQKRNLL